MSSAPLDLTKSRPDEDGSGRFEPAIRRFEERWHAGERPALDDFLTPVPAERQSLLVELVHVELELRLKAGEPARVEEYLERFPELAREPAVAWGLLVAEYTQRARIEPELSAEEYARRFPQWRARLENDLSSIPLDDSPPSSAVTRYTTLVCSAPLSSARWPVVPGYEILGELGRGGMGVVYKAWQLSLKRVVALKVVRAGAGPEDLARFRTEAEAAARLRHPGIVQIHEVGEAGGQPYLTLEYVEGGSLNKRLDGTPWEARKAAALVRALAEAVHHAHRQGVVHRDLKPGNILLQKAEGIGKAEGGRRKAEENPEGEPGADTAPPSAFRLPPSAFPMPSAFPKITDFGLAKLILGGGDQTQTGAVLGTPGYMSPEQASGLTHEIGPATDVHALGVLLYELLTGRPPFRGASLEETVQLVRAEEPVPPRRLHPQVGRDLETVCLKCLRKRPADRYTSAADLAEDLRRFEAGVPVRARPPSAWRRVSAWCRRRPASASLVVSAVLLLATVIAGLYWHTQRLTLALEETQRERLKAADNERRAWQSEYASQMRLAQQAFGMGDPFSLSGLLDHHLPAGAGAEDRRDFAWWYLSAHRQPPLQLWSSHPWKVTWLAYSPNGRWLATVGASERTGGSLKVWDARTRALRLTVPAEAYERGSPPVAFGPAAEDWVAVVNGRTVVRWDILTGRQRGKRLEQAEALRAVAVSADGRRLVTAGWGPLTVWDLVTEKPAATFPRASAGGHRLCLPADERTVASIAYGGAGDGLLQLWDVPTRRPVALTPLVPADIPLARSARGSLLTTADADGRLLLVKAGADERGRFTRFETRGVPGALWDEREAPRVTALALSPDERTLAVGGADGAVRFWDVASRTKRAVLRWQGNRVTCLGFSPDGKTLAAGTRDGMVFQLAVPGWQVPDTLRPTLAPYRELACSPDGKTLAVADRDGSVKLIDAATGAVRAALTGQDNVTRALVFSGDGYTLASVAEHDGSVVVWDVTTGRMQHRLHVAGASSVAFAPGEPLLAVGSPHAVTLFDRTGRRRATLPSQDPAVAALAFSGDGRTLVSAGMGRVLEVWDLSGGQPPKAPRHSQRLAAAVSCAALSADGRRILTGDEGGHVRFWEVAEKGLTEARGALPLGAPCRSLTLARDGRTFLTYGPGQHVQVWDAKTGKLRHKLWHSLADSGEAGRAVLSPNGARFALISSEDTLEMYDRKTWTRTLPAGQPLFPVRALLFTPVAPSRAALLSASRTPERKGRGVFGSLLLDARAQQCPTTTLRFWDPGSGAELPGLEGPLTMAPPELAALSPDGRLLAAGGCDGRVLLWDRRAGRLLPQRLYISPRAAEYVQTFDKFRASNMGEPVYPEGLAALAFSPNGKLLVTAGTQGAVRVWAADDGREVASLALDAGGPVWAAFGPGGELVVPRGGQVEFLDPRDVSGAARFRLGTKEGSPAVCVTFSGRGDQMAVAHANRRIRLWDLATRRVTGDLIGHMDRITALAFSPDGKTLASGSHDRTVKLWSVAAAAAVASLEQHHGRVHCLAFAPDGMTLASGGEGERGQGEVFLWRAPRR